MVRRQSRALSLPPLLRAPCAAESRLFAFFLARVAREEPIRLQGFPNVRIVFFQGARQTMANRFGLCHHTASPHLHRHCKSLSQNLKRRQNRLALFLKREVRFKRLLVHFNFLLPRVRIDAHPRRRGFAPPHALYVYCVRFCHHSVSPISRIFSASASFVSAVSPLRRGSCVSRGRRTGSTLPLCFTRRWRMHTSSRRSGAPTSFTLSVGSSKR